MKNIDECHKDFSENRAVFEEYKNQDLTESDTRSKIIDFVFTRVLDWDEQNISREGYVKSGYYDYLFSIPGFKFIVEAKREFKRFNLPIRHKSTSLGIFEKTNKEEVEQVRRYLFEKGLQYAVITNGCQYIIEKFLNIDGSDWKDNRCLIFDGFDDIDERFIDFYNILSKTSVSENAGFGVYLEELVKKEGKTVLSTLPEKDNELVRNSLSSEIAPIINNLFGELGRISETMSNELIRECFIENQEIKKNRSEIEKLFSDLPPSWESVLPARNTASIVTQIKKEIADDNLKFNEDPPNPIVIIGSKGAGKTTFIHYLFSNYSEQSHPYVYIDFRNYAEIHDNFTNKIYGDILDRIYEKYGQIELCTRTALCSIYHNEIKRNDSGIWKYNLENNKAEYEKTLSAFFSEKQTDREEHFFRLSEYMIKKRRTRLCIIIDNADQFDIETQKKVFLFAQSINKKGNVIIILSLREGYYYKLRHTPPFDAFACNVYHVTAPHYKDVLQKRIDYALSKIDALEGNSSGDVENKTFNIKNDDVRVFMLGLKTTLFGDHNSEILEFIQETTYPNIRDGLDIFKQFLISGHTKVSEYILRYRTNNHGNLSKAIPYWEFIKAVGLDNRKYYKYDISTINNLFYPVKGSCDHFLKIRILRFLNNKLDEGGNTGKYCRAGMLMDEFISIGYTAKYLIAELEELCKWRMVETDEFVSDTENSELVNSDSSICISRKGHYYVNVLVNKLPYVEMALEDTPIFSNDVFSNIKTLFPKSDNYGKRDLRKRVEVAKMFIEYLNNEEKSQMIETRIYTRSIVKEIELGTKGDVDQIEKNCQMVGK